MRFADPVYNSSVFLNRPFVLVRALRRFPAKESDWLVKERRRFTSLVNILFFEICSDRGHDFLVKPMPSGEEIVRGPSLPEAQQERERCFQYRYLAWCRKLGNMHETARSKTLSYPSLRPTRSTCYLLLTGTPPPPPLH